MSASALREAGRDDLLHLPYDPDTGHVGVGAITARVSVGRLVSPAQARVGAAASQAMMNPYLAFDSLALLADGRTAQQALDEAVSRDDGQDFLELARVTETFLARLDADSEPASHGAH